MTDLIITEIVALPDDGASSSATVVSSWGTVGIRYRFASAPDSLQSIDADLAQLTPPEDVPKRVAGAQWIPAVAAALLQSRVAA